ncbi:MAG TPA: DUF4214 domain-containing protein [Kofleriaceae bacterium]|jgi:hypothetical protein|nr:DUF4214 domain-containing protein [Kofleriaceae bacterium]
MRPYPLALALALAPACAVPDDDPAAETVQPLTSPLYTATRFAASGVNTTATWQSPTDVDVFYGRRMFYAGLTGENPNNEATWHYWTPAVYDMDWANHRLVFRERVFELDATHRTWTMGDGRAVYSAYDPSVVVQGGQRLMAFECVLQGFVGTVGTCIGELDASDHLIAARTQLVVAGVSVDDAHADHYPSASAPKLYQSPDGRLAVMWTRVEVLKAGHTFRGLTTRGVWLERGANGRWTARGTNGAAIAADDPRTVEIGRQPDGTEVTFDLYGIANLPGNGQYIATSATGGEGCNTPLDPPASCYALDVRVGPLPRYLPFELNDDGLHHLPRVMLDLPRNPNEYVRLVRTPDGDVGLFGAFLRPNPNTPDHQLQTPGMYLITHPSLTHHATAPRDTSPLAWQALAEGPQRAIVRLYQEALGRRPALSEVQGWMDTLRTRGLACDELEHGFLFSPELARWLATASAEQVVTRLYRAILARDPDPAGFASWVAAYRAQGFAPVANGFLDSTEAGLVCATDQL